MKKNRNVLYFIGILIVLLGFPIGVSAKNKVITCDYSYKDQTFDLDKVKFSYIVYDDSTVEFKYTSCPGKQSGTTCQLIGGQVTSSVSERNFYNTAYKTGTYQCPQLGYTGSSGLYSISLGVNEEALRLDMKQTSHDTSNTYAHKLMCAYSQSIDSIRTTIKIYYEQNGIYSTEASQNGRTIDQNGPSNKDLTLSLGEKSVYISPETLQIFNDYDPSNSASDYCNNKQLYFNMQEDGNYLLETSRGGIHSSPGSDPNGNGGSQGDNLYNPGEVNADCGSLLGDKLTGYLKTIFTIIQVAGIILAIILGMGDFIGAVLSGEADNTKKASKKFVVRIAMAAALLIVPAILKLVLNTFGVSADNTFCIL